MTHFTTSDDCPSDTTLAAWLEGALDSAERESVQQHLQDCRRCLDIVTESAETLDGIADAQPAAEESEFDEESETERKVVPIRSWRWPIAAAAVLIPLMIMSAVLLSDRAGPQSVSQLARLAAVAPPERLLDVRVSGLDWRPPAPARRSIEADESFALLAEVERLREIAMDDPSPQNIHALAAAHLVAGDPAKAIELLEQIPQETLPDAARADYAASLVAEGRRIDESRFCARAIDLLAPLDTPAAHFNEALAYECTGQTSSARDRWIDYLKADESSDWASEARSRLARLE